MKLGSTTKHGSALKESFEATLQGHSEAAASRNDDVQARIAELEAELSDLRQLRRKIDAAKSAA